MELDENGHGLGGTDGHGQGNGNGQNGGDGDPGEELTLDQRITNALQRADAAFEVAAEAQANNDTAEWAAQLEIAQEQVELAVRLAGQCDTPTPPDAEE